MNFRLLHDLDRWFGPPLLRVLGPLLNLLATLPREHAGPPRHVFLKLKGGGSLLVAMPALLGLRRAAPQAEFVLVCTADTKGYAELLGIFDQYIVIDDRTPVSLIQTALTALKECSRAELCVDLELNSTLAAVFCALTLAQQRIGLVKMEQPYRAAAYSDAISFNDYAPIYLYYDQIAKILKAAPASMAECRGQLLGKETLPQKSSSGRPAVGLSPFTSDFARERMMPVETWIALLAQISLAREVRFVLFGSDKNKPASEAFAAKLREAFPAAEVANLCGQGSLRQAALEIMKCEAFWSVDSGLLHLARLLGVRCRSFWGPTMPSQRLRPIPGLVEEAVYRRFACSPCVHHSIQPPCNGNNLCMKTMTDASPDLALIWPAKDRA